MLSYAKGLLITTDITTAQIIVYLNEENNKKIILKYLDDTHILIDPRYEEYVKTEVVRLLENNVYERTDQ